MTSDINSQQLNDKSKSILVAGASMLYGVDEKHV